ncbi:BZ3500_MvSof-1268-A1-R1_Chr9g10330 [Microbotryum saponariae]|uniref:endo-polygalacturonase n=1 Tax=Microbotryum saponariae TaxID=289078 RepID=A0A2X0KCM2_9BASI|nr:BZ3501_MvSof-1269-A2-R1_Chr9g10080 [Microbotryum saponariae]SCZ99910.1 BZ3500_MvSof-1268-A1-R1_Chr9g10330 [Microbotryum saponariae]
MLCKRSVVFVLASSSLVALASSQPCTIADARDIPNVQRCSVITIKAFIMPAGRTLMLDVQAGTKINQVYGDQITYNGNNHKLECQGERYWDSKGALGTAKPGPALSLLITGSVSNLVIHNTPLNAVVVEAPGKTLLSNIFVNNTDGARMGHNTDGFNVVQNTYDLTISGCRVINQDDCISITSGTRITITQNKCSGGHGISIGSIRSNEHVSNVLIAGNAVENSAQGYRIKTLSGATRGSVSDITYSGNTGTGLTNYGVVIEQDYTESGPKGPSGATNGVLISNVKFIGRTTTLSVMGNKAQKVYVLCGDKSCFGKWDWSGLKFTGNAPLGSITRAPITVGGFTEFSS